MVNRAHVDVERLAVAAGELRRAAGEVSAVGNTLRQQSDNLDPFYGDVMRLRTAADLLEQAAKRFNEHYKVNESHYQGAG